MDLRDALRAAVCDSVKGKRAVGVLFSGGLDSSVLAFLAKECDPSAVLYAAGVEGSEDLAHARENAKLLGMTLREVVLGDADLVRLFGETRAVAGETDFMKVELGLVLLALCSRAEMDGARTLLSGAGAEELFLGYHAHSVARGNLEALRKREIAGLYEKDIRRSERIAAHCKAEILLPFLDSRVVAAALSVPAAQNFSGGENKAVLRAAARSLGLPERICARRKRAMQYGSGVHARLLRLRRTKVIKS